MMVRINVKKLILARYSMGLSVKALAEIVGISPCAIYHIEDGKTTASPATLKKMCEVLNVNISDILDFNELDA